MKTFIKYVYKGQFTDNTMGYDLNNLMTNFILLLFSTTGFLGSIFLYIEQYQYFALSSAILTIVFYLLYYLNANGHNSLAKFSLIIIVCLASAIKEVYFQEYSEFVHFSLLSIALVFLLFDNNQTKTFLFALCIPIICIIIPSSLFHILYSNHSATSFNLMSVKFMEICANVTIVIFVLWFFIKKNKDSELRLKSSNDLLNTTIEDLNTAFHISKSNEIALSESETIQKILFEVSPLPILISRLSDGKIINVNNALVELIGYSKEILFTKTTLEFYPNINDRENFKNILLICGKVKDFQINYRVASGKIIPVLVSSEIVIIKGEKLLISSFYDISERIAKENELKLLLEEVIEKNEIIESEISEKNILINKVNSLNSQLEETMKAKGKVFSILAHDLRSPFSGFLGLTKVLVDSFKSLGTNELYEILNALKISASSLYELLDSLLDWLMVESGRVDYNPTFCTLKDVFENNIELVQARSKMKNINCINNLQNQITVFADIQMLNCITRNILSNALKFTQSDGEIIINAEQRDEDVMISIADNGIGMPENISSRLFKIGENVSRRGTANEASIGLGLLLCKDYVDLHKGNIWVESEEGKGSTFYFTIPKAMTND